MRKRVLSILLVLVLILSMTGCGKKENLSNSDNLTEKEETNQNNEELSTEEDESLKGVNLYELLASQAKTDLSDEDGIYITKDTDSGNNVYYFKGNIETNNYLILGKYCWRIIRTTETNGVKIIYSGNAKDNKCSVMNSFVGTSKFNSKFFNNAYVGFMYGNVDGITYSEVHANKNDSVVKAYLDDWFKKYFIDYQNALEDTLFCNDRSISSGTGIGNSKTIYAVDTRVEKNTPTLKCAQSNDRFTVSESTGNGALTYPIDLINADEVMLAGNVGYLFTNSIDWTMSPSITNSSGNVYNYTVDTASLDYSNVPNALGIRPVVSLKRDTEVNIGSDGSYDKPYIVTYETN